MNNSTENPSAAGKAEMLGEIILSARKVEQRLRDICAPSEVTGIHALTELLSGRLSEDVKRQLHYIATIRNHAAHEDNFELSAGEFASFQSCVESVYRHLDALFPPAEKSPASPEENPADSEKALAVERELFARISGKLSLWGYVPLLGNIYIVYLLLYTVFLQGYLVLLTALYACSLVLGIKGWQSANDRGLLYTAIGAFVFVYIVTMVLCFKQPLKKIHPAWGLIPGLNMIYLPLRWLRDLKWVKFLTAVLGLALLAAAVILALKHFYMYGLIALGANWLTGVTAAALWGKVREK